MKFKEIIPLFEKYKIDFVKASTVAAYLNILENHLAPYFGEYTDISQKDIDEYLYIKKDQGLSKKTLESHVTTLKTIFNWGNKTGNFKTKPFRANYPNGAIEKIEIKPFSVEEAKLFCKHCEENFSFINLMLYTAIFTGLRAGELCGLQWKDIDVDNGFLSVNKSATRVNFRESTTPSGQDFKASKIVVEVPKTPNSIREVPLSKQLIFFFKPLKKLIDPERFIGSNSLEPMDPKTLRNHLANILEAIKLPDNFRMHDLRHTFATRCISMGIDAKTVSVLLGHSTVVTTLKTYMHTDDEAKTDAMEKLTKKMKW